VRQGIGTGAAVTVIGEAMACGVTDMGDAARIVEETGMVVPPRHSPALMEGWQKLIELGPPARQQLGWMAREHIQQYYSLEQIVQRYETFYMSLVKEQSCVA